MNGTERTGTDISNGGYHPIESGATLSLASGHVQLRLSYERETHVPVHS